MIIGAPQDSGISLQTVLELGPIVPLFGVCMGLQCIGEAFGGELFSYILPNMANIFMYYEIKHLFNCYGNGNGNLQLILIINNNTL